jgi:hypothetical protein
MAAYLEAVGLDPYRSDPRVEAATQRCGVPVRIITGLWQNEIEKRLAGYRACRTRYIFRVDADEILVIDPAPLEAFFASGDAVAQMEMPICVAPGLIRVSGPDARIERQSLLFDTHRVSAEAHLHLLWLVLGPEPLPPVAGGLPMVHSVPVAFNFHLTEWRTPATSIIRASFYTLNYARLHGLPWINAVHGGPCRSLSEIFARYIAPSAYRQTLLNSELVINFAQTGGGMLRPISHTLPRLNVVRQAFLHSLADLNLTLVGAWRSFVSGEAIMLDVSSLAARQALTGGHSLRLASSRHLSAARVEAHFQLAAAPWHATMTLANRIEGKTIHVHLPDPTAAYQTIRQVISVTLWCDGGDPVQQLTVLPQ